MLAGNSGQDLTRRIVTYYLMFGLAAVIWLALGLVFVAKAVLDSRSETECFTRLGEAASALRAAAVRRDTELQDVVQRLRAKWSLAYCAVVGKEGMFLAHSCPDQVGSRRIVPTGSVAHWGDIQRTRYMAEDSRVLREYQGPVRLGPETAGTVLLAVPDGGAWQPVMLAADYAPFAFLAPMAFVFLGAVVMRRFVRPIAKIEGQLCELAGRQTITPHDVRPVADTDQGVGRLESPARNLFSEPSAGSARPAIESSSGELSSQQARSGSQ